MSRDSMDPSSSKQQIARARLYRAALAGSMLGLLAAATGCPNNVKAPDFNKMGTDIGNTFTGKKSAPAPAPRSAARPVVSGPNIDGDKMVTTIIADQVIKPPTPEMSCDEAWAHLEKNKQLAGWGDFIANNKQFSDKALAQDQEAQASAQLAGKLPLEALEALVEDGAAMLAERLPLDPAIKKAQRKQVLVVGKFENNVTANKELDFALSRLKGRLMKQKAITDNFVVVGMTEEAGAKAMKQAGAGQYFEFTDPLDPTAQQGPTKYNPKTIYAVSGQMIESRDPLKHRMSVKMAIDVTHSASRTSTVDEVVDAEYRFHPARKEWISQKVDDELAKK